MSDKPLTIGIEVEDWRQEMLREEEGITGTDDILKLLEEGMHTSQVARYSLVSRALGFAPSDIMRPDKLLLLTGAQIDISRIPRNKKHPVKTASGEEYQVPDYVGTVPDSSEENGYEQSYVRHDDIEALNRVRSYLRTQVMGHIRRRLLILYEHGGDVEDAADELKGQIDAFVEKITRPSS